MKYPHIAFFDTETSGLDPNTQEILSLAIVRVDAKTFETIGTFYKKIQPTRIHLAAPKALEVNGYTAEKWADAVDLKSALTEAVGLLKNAVWGGHNVSFDVNFLSAAFANAGVPMPQNNYHKLDTMLMAWPYLVRGEVSSMSLDAMCKLFGISRPEPHDALDDVKATIEVAKRMILK
jgi:DNA polymerase-3 subunit epsilon